LISEHTVEENILKKANQKRLLDRVAIDGGKFTTEFFQEVDLRSVIDEQNTFSTSTPSTKLTAEEVEQAMASAEDESDVAAMNLAKQELRTQDEEFSEDLSVAVCTTMCSLAMLRALYSRRGVCTCVLVFATF
jgi:helicase SWR1